jgi:hypothetical protein
MGMEELLMLGLRREVEMLSSPVAHLEPEVAEAALQDCGRRRGAACGRRGGPRRVPRPTAPGPGPLPLLVRSGVVPGHRMSFLNFVNLNNKFIHCVFIVYT